MSIGLLLMSIGLLLMSVGLLLMSIGLLLMSNSASKTCQEGDGNGDSILKTGSSPPLSTCEMRSSVQSTAPPLASPNCQGQPHLIPQPDANHGPGHRPQPLIQTTALDTDHRP